MNRIERWLWYGFLFTIPWQTRVILWQADPVFSEWRAIALWLTDVVMVGLWILAWRQGWRVRPDRIDWLLIPLLGAGALSLLAAPAPALGLYHLARLAQFAVFFLYLRHWAFQRFDVGASVLAFTLGGLVQAGIGWGQAIIQRDLGLRWLGETLLTPFMHGVAVFYDTPWHRVMRAYGVLPHPNLLAMVLALATWGLGWLWLRIGPYRWSVWMLAPWAIVGAVLLWVFGLTYARTVAAVWAAGTIVLAGVLLSNRALRWPNAAALRKRFFAAMVLVGVVGGLFMIIHWPQVTARMSIHGDDEAVRLRFDYARDALASGGSGAWYAQVNWIGVGLGNFTSWLAEYDPSLPDYLLQPAHSVYLLAYAETGVLGVVALATFVCAIVWRAWRSRQEQPFLRIGLLVVLAAVVLAATWDHFFWTLQQGRIMWWLVLALAAGRATSYNQSHVTRSN